MSERPIDAWIRRFLDDRGVPERSRGIVREALSRGPLGADEVLGYCAQTLALARAAVDDASLRATAAWVIESLQLVTSAPPAKAVADEDARVYFSPGDDCLDAIRRSVRGARRSADVCVFTITDDRIADELLAAHRRGVALRVITDNDKSFDEGSDVARLRRAGVAVRIDETDAHMHHKFAVFDGSVVLTGSYNWTRSAARVNQENVVVTRSAALARGFSGEFERLWTRFEAPPRDRR